MGSPNEFREAQLSTLRFLGDKAQQLDFAGNVHYDDYASEIYFWWLDVFDPEDAVFTAAFSAAELAALSRFADLYREFDRRLPERRRTMEELHATPEWQGIVRAAQSALSTIGDMQANSALARSREP